MLQHVSSAFLAAIVLVTPLAAQRGAGGGLPILAPSASPATASHSFHSSTGQHGHAYGRAVYLGTPYWGDSSSSSYQEAPPVIVVQAPPTPSRISAVDKEEPKPAAPLLIELQGDRYVRRTTTDTSNARSSQPDYAAEGKANTTGRANSTPPRTELPPTLFIFRDGHQEESGDYSIIAGVIYARGEYWTSGSWSKQIPISQLDLPSTFKANQERGVKFVLPGGPNEVVTRF